MNRYRLSTRAGRIGVAEFDFLWEPETVDPDKKPVILLHGAGSQNYSNFARGGSWATCLLAPRLAWGGRKCIAGWMSSQSFANDAVMDSIDSALTVLGATEAHLVGFSMGGGIAVRYASLNPTKTTSVLGLLPMADINTIYNTNRGGYRAEIGTAWGVTYPTALPSQADLIGVHAPVINTNNTPARILYSSIDVLTLPAEVEAMATAMGIVPEVVDSTYGHTEASTAAAMNLDPTAPWQDYIDWIDGLDV